MRITGCFVGHRRAAAAAIAVAVLAIGAAATVMARPDIPGAGKPGGPAVAPRPDGTSTPGPVGPAAGAICDSEEALCALPAEFANNLHDSAAWQLEDKLLPSEAACSEAGVSPVLRASACPGDSTGARASGYTVVGLGKRPALLERQEFLGLVESWRALARGRDIAPLSVACAITVADTVDCQSAAAAVALRDRPGGPVDAVFVFFVRRVPGGKWCLVGASGGLPDGAVLTGGSERRLMAGWTGNPTGGWYFELLPSPDPVTSRRLTPAEVAEGVTLGRVAVLPPGAVPSYDWYDHADKAEGEIELPPLPVDDPNVAKLGLTLHQVSPPSGFSVSGRQVTAVVRPDGTGRLFAEGVTLSSPDYWPVTIEIYSIKDGRNAETVAPAGGGPVEMSVYDADGTPVLIEHGASSSRLQPALRAAFVVGSDYVIVNAGPLPVEILTDLVDRFVAENSQ